jgi:hypothetical protein
MSDDLRTPLVVADPRVMSARRVTGLWRSAAKHGTVATGRRPRLTERFDPDRFDELVLYIAQRTQQTRDFGRIKLAKVLFYSDFTAYRETGASLTGATYIRLPKGPFPRELDAAEKRLEQNHRVRLAYDVGEYEEKRIVPLEPQGSAAAVFEAWQLDFVRSMIADIAAGTARRASDRSHEHAGWIVVERTGAEIPYAAAFVPDEPPTGLEAEKAKRIARDRAWLTDAGWQWERGTA